MTQIMTARRPESFAAGAADRNEAHTLVMLKHLVIVKNLLVRALAVNRSKRLREKRQIREIKLGKPQKFHE